ncbi:MAG: restriction endonuclease subunit S [Deltaproteobacteria bacterium]|nr:restriction endonuclease subunit S [Deltaproteobacteria bacterium]
MINIITNIAEIKSGFLFKTGLTPDKEGNVSVIQLRDIDGEGNLHKENLIKVLEPSYVGEDCVRKGDILFKAKTDHPVAAMVAEELKDTLVTAHYFIIRLKTTTVLPAYLSWYLNQKPARMYFDKHAGGTRVQIINKQVLGNLEIIIPELTVQEKIVKINSLYQRESALLDLLREKKQKLIAVKLLNIVSS